RLEQAWLEQLSPGALLSAPLALAPGLAFVICGTVVERCFEGQLVRAAYFMPLRAENELGASDESSPEPSDGLDTSPAPWADWVERRRGRVTWLRLAQSLAFFGWLRGLSIALRTQSDCQPIFGLQDASGEANCWLGPQRWQFNGPAGE